MNLTLDAQNRFGTAPGTEQVAFLADIKREIFF
jgi:hypothetical protein